MSEILHRLQEEDPCLRLEHPQNSHQTVLWGLGELHLRTVLERLHEQYRFDVDTEPPRIAYRETATAAAEGHHRHKKQSGGAGQFGEVHLRVEPLPRGAGFEFVDAVKGGVIPGQFIPAVERGVREVLAIGAISGHPIVDVRVTVFDGKHHSVDSKEVAFVTAARKAMLAAMAEARAILLEPLVDLAITVPADLVGDITGDLASRRAQVNGTESRSGTAQALVVRATAPLAELSNYQSRLNALTSGQGSFTLAFSRYEAVPPGIQQKLAEAYRPADD